MGKILYLVHRLPYPPNKGDKVRSYHLLKHLAARHKVYLGTFVDDPDDRQHIETVRRMCAGLHVATLSPRFARLRSLNGLVSGEALTLPYYRDPGLQSWVDDMCRMHEFDAAVIFSSAMAQYVDDKPRLMTLVDFVDVDSAKWTAYGQSHRGPKAWIYRREGRCLLDFERTVAARAARSFFVTDNEADLFRSFAPECAVRVETMANGVDAEYFSPGPAVANPFPAGETPIVFTGAMDYHPNEDAAVWFAREVFLRVREKCADACFYVVGRSPTAAVQALAGGHVRVTGTVADVRPYLQHAAAVVAPLRIARGIQNKILEAMAMARPVVASAACAGGVDATPGRDFLVATTPIEFAERLGEILATPQLAATMGRAARQRVIEHYSWDANMARIDRYLDGARSPASPGAAGGTP